MAVPKKRTGASAQGHRRANWKATVPETTTCKNCNALVLTHTVCPECGYYKKAAVSIKNENYVALDAVKKEKKAPAKKAATKTPVIKKAVLKDGTDVTPKAEAEEVKTEAPVEAKAEAVDVVKPKAEEKTEE